MRDYYIILVRRLKKIDKTELLSTRFIKTLSDIEMCKIINYNEKDFKLYFETLELLYKNNIIVTKEIEDNTKKVLDMLFSNINKKNKIEYLTLLTDTLFLHCKNVVSATFNYLCLDNKLKADAVIDIFSNYERPYLINANKIIFEIKRCKNKKQINALINLFTKESLLKNKNLSYLVELIHEHPNYKYYQFPVYLAIYNDFLNSSKTLFLLSYLFKVHNLDDIKLIFNCLRTSSMLNSSICIPLIELIIKDGHKEYYKYYNKLVLNKDKISDISFNKITNAIKQTKNKYQIEGLLTLINTSIINSSFINIFINAILNTKLEYKIKSILNIALNENNFKNFEIVNSVINGIINSKYECQVNCLLLCLNEFNNTIYYKDIIDEINRSNDINCNYINLFLQKKLYNRKNFLNLFYRLIDYKTKEQKELFIKLLDINDLFNYDYNNTFNMIERSNEYQCNAILELYNHEFYKNEYFNLIKYLFIFKDSKHIDLFKEILMQIDKIGYNKAIELIRLIVSSNVDIDIIYNYYINNLKKRIIEFDVKDLNFYTKITNDEIKKIKLLKIDNMKN